MRAPDNEQGINKLRPQIADKILSHKTVVKAMLSYSLLSCVRAEEGELLENHINPTFHFYPRWKREKTEAFQGVYKLNMRLNNLRFIPW